MWSVNGAILDDLEVRFKVTPYKLLYKKGTFWRFWSWWRFALSACSCFCFSSNGIATLADFAHCLNMEELYIRNNSVTDIRELTHLKGLSRLRVLWLDGNPCTNDPAYRTSLLQMLPKLHRLDNIGCILI